jgi:hypothetical protein
MRAAVMYVPGDVRVEDRPEPMIFAPTDAIIRLTATRSRQIDAGKVFDPEFPSIKPTPATKPWTPGKRSRSSSVPNHDPPQRPLTSQGSKEHICPTRMETSTARSRS